MPTRTSSFGASACEDNDPLCCCEYVNRRGDRAHCLACCCECDALDQAADSLFSGRRVGNDRIDEILADLDDRLRLPTPGGAWHLGLPRAVPWALLPPLLLLGSISARTLLLAGLLLIPSIFWWHFRALRLRRRSQFLLSWQLASLAWECAVILVVLPAAPDAGTAAFAATAATTLLLLARCKAGDVSSTGGVLDAAGASSRAVVCPVSGVWVPRYDHYCAWIDEPVGASNHRAFVAYLVGMLVTTVLGMRRLLLLHPGSVSWLQMLRSNRSSLFLACFAYAGVIGMGVASLLAHQLWLIVCRGTTTYEDRRRRRQPVGTAGVPASAATRRGCRARLREFGAQTAPVLQWPRGAESAARSQALGPIEEAPADAADVARLIPAGGKKDVSE